MDKDKQIQKIPKYSIDKIGTKSELATRGLRELGLLKDKKHFTIIYVCQFCGRLINYSSTPCIFCGDYPKTRREVIIAQALSSESLDVGQLLAVSKMIKDKDDLEIGISNLRHLTDEILQDPDQFPIYQRLFRLTDLILTNRDLPSDGEFLSSKTKIECKKCGNKIIFADTACLFCATYAERAGKNPREITNDLTVIEKYIVALNDVLMFVENDLDFTDNQDSTEELIFVSVFMLNRLVEKDELPDLDLKNYWRELLSQSSYFGSNRNLHGGVDIDSNGKISMVFEKGHDENQEAQLEMLSLVANISYIAKL